MAIEDGDILRVNAEMTYAGSTVMNVFHLQVDNALTNSDALDEIRDWLFLVYDHVDGIMASVLTFSRIVVVNVSKDEDVGITDWLTLTVGTGSGDGLPPGVALLATFNTVSLGVRGRKYLPGVTEAHVTSSQVWSSTAVSAMDAFADEASSPFTGLFTSTLYTPRIVGYQAVPGGTNIIVTTIISYSVSNVPAYQRRRKQGVGI